VVWHSPKIRALGTCAKYSCALNSYRLSTMPTHIPGKADLKPRKYHGYAVLLFIMGTLFPPLGQSSSSLTPPLN